MEKTCFDGDIIIAGDMNARIGFDQNEHIAIEELNTLLPTDDPSKTSVTPRATCDLTQNRFGKKLQKICSRFDLHVANGRTPCDLLGNFTCHTTRGSSVVDLVIANSYLLKKVRSLNVLPCDFNSVHCPISFSLEGFFSEEVREKLETPEPKIIWDTHQEANFIKALATSNSADIIPTTPNITTI